MGVALPQSTISFLNSLESLFLLILLLNLSTPEFPILLILLFYPSFCLPPTFFLFPRFLLSFLLSSRELATSYAELIINGDFNIHVDQLHTTPSASIISLLHDISLT